MGHDVHAGDDGPPTARSQKPREHPHGRCLSRAVGAEKSKDFAFGDLQREIFHSNAIPKASGQILCDDHGALCASHSERSSPITIVSKNLPLW